MSGSTLHLDESNFSSEVLSSSQPVLVDFWATWCGPCRAIAPVIDELAQEFAGRAKVGKVDVDKNPELAARFRINAIPTLMFFKGGELVEKIVGSTSKAALAAKLESLI